MTLKKGISVQAKLDSSVALNIIKTFILAIKIAVGSCAAIYIATGLKLEFAASAGIITLLTIVTTKYETLKLSIFRIITFFISVFISWVIFMNINSAWISYGVFIFLIVIISECIGWRITLSVNAVIGTHFLTTHDFSFESIQNEFMLVIIGISIAILLNLFQNNNTQKKRIIENMRYTEKQLQMILDELACYLFNQSMSRNVWDDIVTLEKELEIFVGQAFEYQNNTMRWHTSYYIQYFEMRTKQCNVLHSLHSEMKKIRELPKQASIIADYIVYLKAYVIEMNDPKEQLERLEELCDNIKKEELPKTGEEFESMAKLYHILMDLEEFLIFKRRFVEALDDNQFQIYWKP